MFKNQYLAWFYQTMGIDLPRLSNMDEYIDFIVPKVKFLGEDIAEKENFVETRWLEITDLDNKTDAILHIFKPTLDPEIKDVNPTSAYLYVVNGNVVTGTWSSISKSNTIILKVADRHELFDLAFLNSDFFILKKHRNQHSPLKGSKYFFLAREGLVKSSDTVLSWREIMELLFNIYRLNFTYLLTTSFVVGFIIFIILLSI